MFYIDAGDYYCNHKQHVLLKYSKDLWVKDDQDFGRHSKSDDKIKVNSLKHKSDKRHKM